MLLDVFIRIWIYGRRILIDLLNTLAIDAENLIETAWQSSRQTKITETNTAIICQQDVARFQITVNYVCRLQEMDRAH